LRGVRINKVFSKSKEYSDRFLETVAELKLTKITVHAEKDCTRFGNQIKTVLKLNSCEQIEVKMSQEKNTLALVSILEHLQNKNLKIKAIDNIYGYSVKFNDVNPFLETVFVWIPHPLTILLSATAFDDLKTI